MKKLHMFLAAGILVVALPVAAHDGEDHGTLGQGTGVGVGLELQAQQEASAGARGAEQSADARAEAQLQAEMHADTETSEGDEAEAQQHNESNLEFARERAEARGSVVSVSAVEVRGWNPEQKQEFLATVKAHAEVQSGQELENFARGVLAADGNVEAVESSETEVQVRYRVPAKFLGIFDTTLPATVIVEAAGKGEANANVSERVKAKFPWFRVFYSIPEDVRESALEQAVEAELAGEIEAETEFATSMQARLFQVVSNILKVKHEAQVNAAANVEI